MTGRRGIGEEWIGTINLLQVKKKYDKDNLFTCYHCLTWDYAYDVDPALCPGGWCSCTSTPHGKCAYNDDWNTLKNLK